MFRVYDTEKNKWIHDNIYLSHNGDLIKFNNKFIGNKTKMLSDNRFVIQVSIGMNDKNNCLIYEGDICESTDGKIGVITYSTDVAAYIFLDYKTSRYYPLGDEICSKILKIIGNVFDNKNLIPKPDENES